MIVNGVVLTTGLEPTTPGSPEESLATRPFPPLGGGKKYGTIHLVHVHRGINGTVLRNHDTHPCSLSEFCSKNLMADFTFKLVLDKMGQQTSSDTLSGSRCESQSQDHHFQVSRTSLSSFPQIYPLLYSLSSFSSIHTSTHTHNYFLSLV